MKRSNLGLVYLAIMAIVALLASCSTTKTTYEMGNGSWKPATKNSQITGWVYDKK